MAVIILNSPHQNNLGTRYKGTDLLKLYHLGINYGTEGSK